MKSTLLSIVGLISLEAFAVVDLNKPVDQLTDAEKAERKQIMIYRRTGGFITKREANPGVFAIVDAQSRVAPEVYQEDLKSIEQIFKIDVSPLRRDANVTVNDASKVLKEIKANAALFLVYDAENPNAILLSPEGRWGILNFAALEAGKSAKEIFEKRVRREFWRGFAMTAGSPHTEMLHCLLNPIFSQTQLDDFSGNTIGPEALSRIEATLRKMGIKQYYRCSYKTACRQGWAPAPTNEIQKAIWDGVKAESSKAKK